MHPASFYVVVGGNDIFWRVEAPVEAIGAKPFFIKEAEAPLVLTEPNNGESFPWWIKVSYPDRKPTLIKSALGWTRLTNKRPKVVSAQPVFPKHEGAAVFSRVIQATLAKAMRLQGIRTIAETDDNYFANENLNLAMRQQQHGEQARIFHAKAYAQQDACVFSTEWLRDRYYREFRARFGKKGMPELHVCHNNIDIAKWPDVQPREGPLRFGFMGSNSHVWDVNLAYAAFHAAHQNGCETHFIGYNPADPDPNMPDEALVDGELMVFRSEKSKHNIAMWKEVVSQHTKWITPGDYHRAVLPLDIGICPLRTDDFTLGKSDVKAIEYTISGAAVICTNNQVYNRFWKHEETCLMANSPEEFAVQTLRLIREPKLRRELVENARRKVFAERGVSQMREEWMVAING